MSQVSSVGDIIMMGVNEETFAYFETKLTLTPVSRLQGISIKLIKSYYTLRGNFSRFSSILEDLDTELMLAGKFPL